MPFAEPADRSADRAAEIEASIAEIDRLARLLDSKYRIPIIGYPIGLDGILGLIPGIGDAAALVPAAYIIWKAKKFGAPNHLLARMALNTGADTLIGTVPLIGQIFDIVYKSNNQNVAMLRSHLEAQGMRDVTRKSV
jgi:hypothetical protein